jgi:hypothetical protein
MTISFELVPEELGLRDPLFVGAYMGFPDAAVGASGAVRFLVEALHAAPLASWDGDDYYDFAELRPVSRVVPPRDRVLAWPQGEFWVAREVPVGRGRTVTETESGLLIASPAGTQEEPRTRSLVLFLAPEPRLRWRTYARELAAMAKRCGVRQAVFFGAAFADIPHTRPPIITGWATEARLRSRLEAQGIPFSAYQGPSSMQSASIEAFREAEIPCASLFSNGPHYLPLPNANLATALLRRMAAIFELKLDLSQLEEAGQALTRQANAAMEDRTEFREHVHQLEAQFDEQATPLAPGEVRREAQRLAEEANAPLNVDPADVVRGVEDFLRRRQQTYRQSQGQAGEQPGEEGEDGEGEDGEGGESPGQPGQPKPPDRPEQGGDDVTR